MTPSIAGPSSAAEKSARLLGWLRVLTFGTWVAKLAAAPMSRLAVLPAELLDPPWLLRFMPIDWSSVLTASFLAGLQGSTLLFCVLAALGARRHRLVAFTAAAMLTVQQGLIRSYGFSSHEELVGLLSVYVVALWPSADRATWPPSRVPLRPAAVYLAGIVLIATLGCWTYAATGAHRLANHGLSLLMSHSMTAYIVENSFNYSSGAAGVFVLEHPLAASLFQFSTLLTTLMEIAAPAAVVYRRFRRVWLLFLLIFHLITGALLDVMFWQSLVIVGAALLALDRCGEMHSPEGSAPAG